MSCSLLVKRPGRPNESLPISGGGRDEYDRWSKLGHDLNLHRLAELPDFIAVTIQNLPDLIADLTAVIDHYRVSGEKWSEVAVAQCERVRDKLQELQSEAGWKAYFS